MSESQDKKTPEWSIFDRLEELEDIALKLMEKDDSIEPTLKDTTVIAKDSRILAYIALAFVFGNSVFHGQNPEKVQDAYIGVLRGAGLSEETFKRVESLLHEVYQAVKK